MPSRTTTRSLFVLAFWTLFALLVAVQTWLSMITHNHSLARIIGYYTLIWWVWVLFTPLVDRLALRVPFVPLRTRSVLIHLLAALVAAMTHMALWTALTIWIQPFDDMTINSFSANFLAVTLARLPVELVIYFGTLGVAHAASFSRRTAELERSLGAAKLHALELQIQPHFLFNTLNAVSSLVRTKKNDEAVQLIAGLSDLLRYTLDHAGEQRVALEQEATMLRRYLAIQQLRFADRLEVSIDVTDEAKRAAVPTLLLQPLAENAIRHGVSQSAAAARIEVRAFREESSLRIDIFNTGTLRELGRRGIGLKNTIERLQQLYAGAHRFDLRQTAEGVVASISIPWSELA